MCDAAVALARCDGFAAPATADVVFRPSPACAGVPTGWRLTRLSCRRPDTNRMSMSDSIESAAAEATAEELDEQALIEGAIEGDLNEAAEHGAGEEEEEVAVATPTLASTLMCATTVGCSIRATANHPKKHSIFTLSFPFIRPFHSFADRQPQNREVGRLLGFYMLVMAVVPIAVFYAAHMLILPPFLPDADTRLTYSGLLAVVAIKAVSILYAVSAWAEEKRDNEADARADASLDAEAHRRILAAAAAPSSSSISSSLSSSSSLASTAAALASEADAPAVPSHAPSTPRARQRRAK